MGRIVSIALIVIADIAGSGGNKSNTQTSVVQTLIQQIKGMVQENIDLFLQQVQPSLSATDDIDFDLPADSKQCLSLKEQKLNSSKNNGSVIFSKPLFTEGLSYVY